MLWGGEEQHKWRKHEREELFYVRFQGGASLVRQFFSKENEVMSHEGESDAGRRKKQCKGPEAGECLVFEKEQQGWGTER